MSLDKFQQAWKAEASQLKVTFDPDLLSKQVQQSQDQFRSLIFWRDVREIGVSLLMIPVWFAMGIGLSLPWSWWLTVPVLIWIAVFMLIDRKRHPKTPSEPGESLLFYAKESLSQVDHQIWLLKNVFWWYLLPFTISLSAFFIHVAWNTTGTWWGSMLVTAPFGLFLFYLYRWIYRLNQKAVREQLEPRQEHLQRIVANLASDGGGDGSEVDDLVELVSSLSATDQNVGLSSGSSTWSENWNRIVPSWWIVAMILVPTLTGAYCGYRFAFAQAGPVFFQSVVAAVIPFEIMFFGRWYLTAKRYKGQPPTGADTTRPGAPAIFVLCTILIISALAVAAIFSFAAAKATPRPETAGAFNSPVTEESYAKVAPFTDVRWENDLPTVRVNGDWSRLRSIDGIPIEEIMSFSREEYGSIARKRFTEDLVEVLSKMGHDPDWEVALELRFDDGEPKTVRVRMTAVNRRLARLNLELRSKADRRREELDAKN